MAVAEPACGIGWAVCPGCLGQRLTAGAGESVCPTCRGSWDTLHVQPCPWPATDHLIDPLGRRRLCASHAAWKPVPFPALEEDGRDV
jgi:hypothetical protein